MYRARTIVHSNEIGLSGWFNIIFIEVGKVLERVTSLSTAPFFFPCTTSSVHLTWYIHLNRSIKIFRKFTLDLEFHNS